MPLLIPLLLSAVPQAPTFPLWPGGNPDGWGRPDTEETVRQKGDDFVVVRNVSRPTLQFFHASHARPEAPTVIVCPGGGYAVEAIEHEGWEIAERLNRSGIHAAVLKYRLPNKADRPLNRAPLQDAQRAVRFVRSHAIEWGLDPARVGIMGFSAGGNLAAATSVTDAALYVPVDGIDGLDFRPAFTILVYPAYLTSDLRPPGLADLVVPKNAPPAFIVQTMDDPHAASAFAYALDCRKAGVPAELHLFPKGGHGYGIRTREPGLSAWPDLLATWLHRTTPL